MSGTHGSAQSTARQSLLRRASRTPGLVLYAGLAVAILAVFLAIPTFRTGNNLNNLILRCVPLLAVAAGQTFVLISGGIDLSVGAIVSLSTCVASVTMGRSVVLGVLLALASGAVVGLVNGVGITRLKINPFLMTLGMMTITNGIALFIRPYPGGVIPAAYSGFVLLRVGGFPLVPFLLLCAVTAVSLLILRRSRFGRRLYAVGGNSEAVRLAGISVGSITVRTYIVSGLFAALAGLYLTSRIATGDPAVGRPFQIDSITASVIGGTALTGGKGDVAGTLLGTIVLTLLGNVFNLLDIDIYWQQILRGLILFAVVSVSQISYIRASRYLEQ
jgi:ribose/xylose/arabinose/galactoside ABC-type transport system permease subunit